ncbi:MAG TPA: hypothetical protein VKD72_16930 [Gemmataceae bacterium]|nr:hypothetical protein [Gemmataceae bacterium]
MSHRSSAGARRSTVKPSLDSEEVLETLHALIPQVASPVVQECLRSARYEIAHLTSTQGELHGEDEEDQEAESMRVKHHEAA